jgi:hypothetical protein
MYKISPAADRVIAWLGPARDDSDDAMDAIPYLSARFKSVDISNLMNLVDLDMIGLPERSHFGLHSRQILVSAFMDYPRSSLGQTPVVLVWAQVDHLDAAGDSIFHDGVREQPATEQYKRRSRHAKD